MEDKDKRIEELETTIRKILSLFDREAFKYDTLHVKTAYNKIVWGIHDLINSK